MRGETKQAYQHFDILRAVTMIYFDGGECLEDVMAIGRDLMLHPGTRIPSSDTIARGLKELAEENTTYTFDKGNEYNFNVADKLNDLLLDMLVHTEQLKKEQSYWTLTMR